MGTSQPRQVARVICKIPRVSVSNEPDELLDQVLGEHVINLLRVWYVQLSLKGAFWGQ
jgi:ABC-type ATPase involved in cell division